MSAGVVQAFAESTRIEDDFLYVLLDPLAGFDSDHPLHPSVLAAQLGADTIIRLPRPDFAHAPEALPVIVTLALPGASPDDELIALSQGCAVDDAAYGRRHVCGWLASPLAPEAMASHLVSLCELAQPAATGAFVPLYEPPRLELWAAAVRSSLGAQLWPVRHWLYPTSWGSFALFTGSAQTGCPAPAPVDLPPVAREAQREALLVRDMLAAWRQSLHVPMSYAPRRWRGETLLPPQAAVHAFRMIRDARRLRLHDSEDIIALALHQVTVHPDLPDNERVRADIARAANGEAPLSTLFETYDAAAWRSISSSLSHAGDEQ